MSADPAIQFPREARLAGLPSLVGDLLRQWA